MTLLEVMERVGSREPERVKTYITDALREIEAVIPEKTTGHMYDVVADQIYYAFPSNMVKLLGVYRKYDTSGKYILIPRIKELDIIHISSSVSTSEATETIVVI